MLCSLSWSTKFSNIVVKHLNYKRSDLWLLLLENISKPVSTDKSGRKEKDCSISVSAVLCNNTPWLSDSRNLLLIAYQTFYKVQLEGLGGIYQ